MKVNREVSNLARKLDLIFPDQEEVRREMIKKCLNPLTPIRGFYLIKYINESYEHLKKEVEEYQKLEAKYREKMEAGFLETMNAQMN